MLPITSILVPILIMLDAIYLTNFSRDGKLWLVYITIDNILSLIRAKSTNHAWIPIALLLIGPKRLYKKTR